MALHGANSLGALGDRQHVALETVGSSAHPGDHVSTGATSASSSASLSSGSLSTGTGSGAAKSRRALHSMATVPPDELDFDNDDPFAHGIDAPVTDLSTDDESVVCDDDMVRAGIVAPAYMGGVSATGVAPPPPTPASGVAVWDRGGGGTMSGGGLVGIEFRLNIALHLSAGADPDLLHAQQRREEERMRTQNSHIGHNNTGHHNGHFSSGADVGDGPMHSEAIARSHSHVSSSSSSSLPTSSSASSLVTSDAPLPPAPTTFSASSTASAMADTTRGGSQSLLPGLVESATEIASGPLFAIDSRRAGSDEPWRGVLRAHADFAFLDAEVRLALRSRGASPVASSLPHLPARAPGKDCATLREELIYYLKVLLVACAGAGSGVPGVAEATEPPLRSFFTDRLGRLERCRLARGSLLRDVAARHPLTIEDRAGGRIRESLLFVALTRTEWAEQWVAMYTRSLCAYDRATGRGRLVIDVPAGRIEGARLAPERSGGCASLWFFDVDTANSTLHFAAASEADAGEWVDAIRNAMYLPEDPYSGDPDRVEGERRRGEAYLAKPTIPMVSVRGRVVLNRRRLLWPGEPGAPDPERSSVDVSVQLLERALDLYELCCRPGASRTTLHSARRAHVDFTLEMAVLQLVSPSDLDHDGRLAFFVNIYNLLAVSIWLQLSYIRALNGAEGIQSLRVP
jgi:hypothetical protein